LCKIFIHNGTYAVDIPRDEFHGLKLIKTNNISLGNLFFVFE